MMTIFLPILLLALVSSPTGNSFKFGSSRYAYLSAPAPYQEVRYYPAPAPVPASLPIQQQQQHQQLPAQGTKGAPLLEHTTTAIKQTTEQQQQHYEPLSYQQAAPSTASYVGAPLVLAAPTRAVPIAMPVAIAKPTYSYQNHYFGSAYPYSYNRHHSYNYDYGAHYQPYYAPYRTASYGYYSIPTSRYIAPQVTNQQQTPLYALEQHHSYIRDFEEPETLDGKLARIKSGLNQVLAKLTTIPALPEQQAYVLMPTSVAAIPAPASATSGKTSQQQEQHIEQQREFEPEQQHQIQEQHIEQHEQQIVSEQTKTAQQTPLKEQSLPKGFKELDSQRTHQPGHQDDSGFKRSGSS